MTILFVACMAATAAFYHLPPRVLPSVQAVEGGRVGLVHQNRNGTSDLGVMQINTIWITPLARYARLAPADVQARLVMDPCFNIAAAGAIMRVYLNEAEGDILTAVGFYHSHSPALRESYVERVLASARRLFERSSDRPGIRAQQ